MDDDVSGRSEFESFVVEAEPRLRRALIGAVGIDRAEDAVDEALAYAFEHWEEVDALDVSTSTVSTHVRRGLDRLREQLGVSHDAHR